MTEKEPSFIRKTSENTVDVVIIGGFIAALIGVLNMTADIAFSGGIISASSLAAKQTLFNRRNE